MANGGKKKAPAQQTQPAQQPKKPVKQTAPPKTPAPKAGNQEKGKDLSETPVTSPDRAGKAEKGPSVPSPDFDPKLAPSLEGPFGPASGLTLEPPLGSFRLPPATGVEIDWFEMRRPFLNRGVMLGQRDFEMIEANWKFTYNMMLNWGLGPDLSAKVANFGTPIAYDFSLQHDYPTLGEEMERDIEKMMGPGKKLSTVIVPVITPDTLGWVTEKITGKKIDFRF